MFKNIPGSSEMTHHTKYSEMTLLLRRRWSATQLARTLNIPLGVCILLPKVSGSNLSTETYTDWKKSTNLFLPLLGLKLSHDFYFNFVHHYVTPLGAYSEMIL